MATVEEIQLPDIGDFNDVEVIEILVAPGDQVQQEQSLLTLESDKATIEIPSPKAGVVKEVKAQVGDRVSRGTPIVLLETDDASAGASAAAPTPAAQAPAAAPAPDATPPQADKPAKKGQEETIAVLLPDVGEFSDIPVIEILVAPGDKVEAEQSLLTLETDKATMEIPAPQAGVVEELAVKIGDTVSAGDLILTLRSDGQHGGTPKAAAPAPAAAPSPEQAQAAETASQRAPGETERRQAPVRARPDDVQAIAKGRKAHASPAIRRFARELGVDLGSVKGSGPKGRVTKDDVQNYVKQRLAQAPAPESGTSLPLALGPAPDVDHSRFGPIETQDLPRIRKISGRHLHRCWVGIPHVTQFDEADITELEAFRKGQNAAARDGAKLTFLPFLLKAVAVALNRMPTLKSSLSADGEQLVLKQYTHIGVAVDTPNGLVVPVLRDVDKKGLATLAAELAEMSTKARDGKLLPGDMQGGCFTISSLGGIGGTAFTPIINAPEVAILGVSKSEMKPVWDGHAFAPRLMLPLSLSYDHRVVDGAEGARFTTLLSQLLGDIRKLLL